VGFVVALLDHRLDQQRGAAQLDEVSHDPDTVGIEAVELRAGLYDTRVGAVRRIALAGPEQHLVVLGCRRSQPTRDHA
jgi:hypothetical protein